MGIESRMVIDVSRVDESRTPGRELSAQAAAKRARDRKRSGRDGIALALYYGWGRGRGA